MLFFFAERLIYLWKQQTLQQENRKFSLAAQQSRRPVLCWKEISIARLWNHRKLLQKVNFTVCNNVSSLRLWIYSLKIAAIERWIGCFYARKPREQYVRAAKLFNNSYIEFGCATTLVTCSFCNCYIHWTLNILKTFAEGESRMQSLIERTFRGNLFPFCPSTLRLWKHKKTVEAGEKGKQSWDA